MSRVIALAFVVAALPAVARAQAPIAAQPLPAAPQAAPPPPVVVAPVQVVPAPAPVNPADGECVTTTTTTTRCSGAAAPYAAHPAAPPVIVAPPLRYDDTPPRIIPYALPSGWTLQYDHDGTLWRVRKHHGNAALWVPGLVLWMTSYIGGMAAGFNAGGDGFAPEATVPMLGPFIAAGFSDSGTGKLAWALDGVAQVGGFVMFIAGATMEGKLERLPVTVGPTSFYGGGGGVSVAGRF